jgi:hypothetical protein
VNLLNHGGGRSGGDVILLVCRTDTSIACDRWWRPASMQGKVELDEEVDVSKRRYVARGVTGGYRIWDNRVQRWWGDLYELFPDDLLKALNDGVSHRELTEAVNRARALRR